MKTTEQCSFFRRKKPLGEMVRRSTFIFLLFCMSSFGFSTNNFSQNGKIIVDSNKVISVVKAFDIIKTQTNQSFIYNPVLFNRTKPIRLRKGVFTVKELLTKISVATGLGYTFTDNGSIVFQRRPLQKVISGRVTDVEGTPLENVTVLVNELERATETDANGMYSIEAKKGDKLSFHYMGFVDKEIIVEDQSVINVEMKEEINILDEVFLIGYGTEKKENIATAISSIKANEIKNNLQSGESFDRGLDGLVKGVMVTQGTGELGKGADVIIRGVTSPFKGGSNNPLYVIDGVAISTSSGYNGSNPLQSINPADIESVDVLKDAAATAIYGSRGANGVIIVKTKQALYDQPLTVNLSFKTTLGVPVKTLDFLDASEFKDYILKLNQNSWDYYKSIKDQDVKNNYALQTFNRLERYGFYQKDEFSTEYFYDPSRIKFGTANTDWNKVTFRSAAVSSIVNASVSGGAEKSAFNVSLGYIDQEGILRADEKQQYNARLSTQFDVSKKLKFGVSANYSNISIKSGYSSGGGGNFITDLGAGTLRFRPDLPVYDKNGAFLYDKVVSNLGGEKVINLYPNPLAITTLGGQNNRKDNMLLTNIFGEYNITKDLTFKTEYTYGIFFSNGKMFRPQQYAEAGQVIEDKTAEKDPDLDFIPEDQKQAGLTSLSMIDGRTINSAINYTLNYAKQFEKSNVKGLLGFSHTHDKTVTDIGEYRDFITDIPLPQYAKIKNERMTTIFNSGLNSYFGRISYGYDDKYTITAVARLDRSSKFAPENRNAFFPSVSASWNIHNEGFMENSFLSELRLRTSAGLTGSVTVGDFAYLQRFNSNATRTYKESPSFAFAQGFANRKLQWEKTTEYNVGLDFEIKKGLVRGTVDLYHKTTSDVVSNESEVVETGASIFERNNAKILNKGFEISLGSDIINTESFSWSIDINAAKNINKVLEVSTEVSKDVGFNRYYTIGREVNLIKGYVVNGIIQTPERLKELNDLAKSKNNKHYDKAGTSVGDYEYKDINGDGKIDRKDETIIGSRQPDLFGGFNTRLRYKGIELSANFSYAYGLESTRFNQALNHNRFLNIERYMSPQYRWSPTNRTATLPRLIHTGDDNESANSRQSSVNVFDASYLRLTSLKLGYDLPEETITNLGFSRVNVYIIGTNLATWTSFPGLDPQGASAGAANIGNTENYDGYPSAKTFSIGVNLQF